MDTTRSLTNRTFLLDTVLFPWQMDDLRWEFLENAFCVSTAENVTLWTIFSIEFLVTSLALYGLCCRIRPNHTVPIFVINLFISDIIQIFVRPVMNFCIFSVGIALLYYAYSMSIIANIGFMVCISMERYVMIKYPVWYRLRNSCKNSSLMSLIIWALPCACLSIDWLIAHVGDLEHAFLLSALLFLLPYPFVVYFFVGSWRALSHSVSVSPDEQKRILRVLALVLFNYTVLFLPSIVQNIILSLYFEHSLSVYQNLNIASGILMYLNPLADALMYVFIRKDASSLLRCWCCEKPRENQIQTEEYSNPLSMRVEVQISIQT